MELIGELERLFATTIYPNRVAVAIGALLLVVLIAAVAWRRGWYGAARRHPRLVAAILVPVLVIGLPLGWYLGSPLFLSTTVDEPGPTVARATSPAPSTAAPLSPRASAPPAATTAPMTVMGTFSGADDFHFGRGKAILIETQPGSYTLRLEDFEVRNGPDLYVYLSPSPDGYADGAVELGRLKADRGNQNYEVPPGADLSAARSVVIWCRQFSVLFATAPLS